MDIEERAEKWAAGYCRERYGVSDPTGMDQEDLVRAYLAGSAQTQKDYVASEGYGDYARDRAWDRPFALGPGQPAL